jgi:hypothetical protein
MDRELDMKWTILLATTLLLVACDKGPFERAGEKVDNAGHELKKGGESVGDKIGDAADDTRDAAKKAARDAN